MEFLINNFFLSYTFQRLTIGDAPTDSLVARGFIHDTFGLLESKGNK